MPCTSSSTAAARNEPVELVVDLRAQPAFDVGAQLVERVELGRGLRELVVERRQDALLQLLDGDGRRCGALPSAELVGDLALSPGARPRMPFSISSTSRSEPSSTT